MKIILIRPFYEYGHVTPPLGIGYLASYLKNNGIQAIIIDALRDRIKNSKLINIIINEQPDIVGITCLTSFYTQVVELSQLLIQNKIRVVIGGIHPTFLPYQTLIESKADFVICGEGEIALLKLIQNNFIKNGIQGVYSLDNLHFESTLIQKAEIIRNLDDLPFPDWEQIPPNTYPADPHGGVYKKLPIGIIMSSRGCPYGCTYCASPYFYERKIRFRSSDNVIDEIIHLKNKFGVKEIQFEDDNLTLRKQHITDICNLLLEKNVNIIWSVPNGVRADKIDEKTIKLMARAGCHYFSIGIETANKTILQNIKKKESLEQIEVSIELAERNGITTQGFFILGLPGETIETLEETINFAKRSKLSRAYFGLLNILPGSELWYKLQGKFTPDWKNHNLIRPEWIPDGLTKEILLKAQTKAMKAFFFKPRRIYKFLKSLHFSQIKYLLKYIKALRIIK